MYTITNVGIFGEIPLQRAPRHCNWNLHFAHPVHGRPPFGAPCFSFSPLQTSSSFSARAVFVFDEYLLAGLVEHGDTGGGNELDAAGTEPPRPWCIQYRCHFY